MRNSAASSVPTIIVFLQDIYVQTQRLHSKWDVEWGGEEDISITAKQATRPQIRAVPDLTGLRTPYHWGHLPLGTPYHLAPLSYSVSLTCYYPTTSLCFPWPSRLPQKPYIFPNLPQTHFQSFGDWHWFFWQSKKTLQVRNPPLRWSNVVLRNIFFSPLQQYTKEVFQQ